MHWESAEKCSDSDNDHVSIMRIMRITLLRLWNPHQNPNPFMFNCQQTNKNAPSLSLGPSPSRLVFLLSSLPPRVTCDVTIHAGSKAGFERRGGDSPPLVIV
jgi:hypothetical protein